MYKYGILSTASIAPRYIKGIRNSEKGMVYGIASRGIDKAKAFAEKYDIDNYYGSYEELINDENIDVVYIPLMNTLHYEYAKKAILNHKYVVVEKPFVLSKKEAEELFELALKEKVFLMEAQKAVFLPTTVKAKQLIEEGAIGTVKYVETRQGSTNRFEADHWMNDVKMGGGALYGSIAYPTEMIQYVCNAENIKANASFIQGFSSADSIVNFHLSFNDILVSATIAMDCDLQNEAVFYGTKGKIVIPSFWKADTIELHTEDGVIKEEYKVESEFVYQVNHINECLDKGLLNSPVMTPDRTIETVSILEELYKLYKPEER